MERRRGERLALLLGTILVAACGSTTGDDTDADGDVPGEGLGDGFDVELLELHHGAKRDAPSGTALAMARAVAEARGESGAPVVDRTTRGRPRERGGVGVAALRGGAVVGEHTLYFLGADERLELTHRAVSRRVFASGALRCARWLAGRGPGRHRIDDLLLPGRSG